MVSDCDKMEASEQVLGTHIVANHHGGFLLSSIDHTCSAQSAPVNVHAIDGSPLVATRVPSHVDRRALRVQEQRPVVSNGSEIQIDNGFVRIHPAILELLAAADLSAGELKCVLFLLRKTYGWGKKEDALSYGQIADAVNLSRRGVINVIQSLLDKHVITVRETKIGRNGSRIYGFNKYFEQWVNVLNGEPQFTISDSVNGEPECTIAPVNGEPQFTNSTQMVNPSSLEMVNPSSPPIDIIDTNTNTPTVSAVADVAPVCSQAEQFRMFQERLKVSTNRPAVLKEIYVWCYGAASAPDYGYLGKVAKQVGGAGRLAQLLFDNITRPPAGDVLAYILRTETERKRRAAQTGGNREIVTLKFNQNGEDSDD